MSPTLVRPLLHTVHVVTFALLLCTGLLLLLPALRALVTGGYSLVIRDAHRWGGVAFAALPALIVLRFGLRSLVVTPEHRSIRTVWQGAHVAVTALMAAAFTATGFVIWGRRALPEGIVEVSRATHEWLTYAAIILVGAHMVEVALAAVVARFTAAAAAATQSQT